MKTKKTVAFARKAFALLAALCMACILCVGAFAETTTNEDVRNDTTGVVQLKVIYTDPNGMTSDIQDGTGFLINDSTVITCNHVVVLDQETLALAAEAFGCSTIDVQNRLSIQVSVLRDVTIKATIKNSSTEMDYAILDLQSQLYDRTYLPIRSSSTVNQTEAAYALGFPGEVERFQDVNTYTSDDVTITAGQVNKINTIGGVDYLQTSARITAGNSGCPLVDNNGAVIGICQGSTGSDFDANYFYAIAIDQLTKTLDSLGISYTKADDAGSVAAPVAESSASSDASVAPPAPTAEPVVEPTADKSTLIDLISEMQGTVEAKNYSEDTAAAFSSALEKAQTVSDNTASTQAEVDAAVTALNTAFNNLKPASNIMKLLPIIIGIVVLVIIVVILIVVLGKKKKPESYSGYYDQANQATQPGDMNNGGFAQVTPAPPAPAPVSYAAPADVGAGETSVLSAGAGETSVLSAGAGETSVLGGGQSFGSLVRTKSGERIAINNANFIIGKERAKVNYCVSDNTSVSRAHVTLRNHGGKTYLVDMKATNGTFVNGTRMNPGQETALNEGDKILLADEEFTFHA